MKKVDAPTPPKFVNLEQLLETGELIFHFET